MQLAASAAFLLFPLLAAAQPPAAPPGTTATVGAAAPQTTQQLPRPTQAAGHGPRARLNTREWNFGSVWYGDPCSSVVELSNAGDAPLTIKNVLTTCGCTIARPTENTLAPGRSTPITLSYNTRKGVIAVSQNVTVETDDPIEPRLQIVVKGEVRPLFDVRLNGSAVQQLNIGQVTPETDVTYRLDLENRYAKRINLRLREPAADAPYTLRFETIEPGAKYRLTATTRRPLKVGTQGMLALLDTDLPSQTAIEIPITAYVMDRVSASPERLYYAPDGPPPQTRLLRLNWLRDRPAKIVALRSSLANVTAQTLPPPAGGAFMGMFGYETIQITLPAWSEIPASGGEIEIVTDDAEPRFQKIVVPLIKFDPKAPAEPATPLVRAVAPPAASGPSAPRDASPPNSPPDANRTRP